jgi:hypothetical protein
MLMVILFLSLYLRNWILNDPYSPVEPVSVGYVNLEGYADSVTAEVLNQNPDASLVYVGFFAQKSWFGKRASYSPILLFCSPVDSGWNLSVTSSDIPPTWIVFYDQCPRDAVDVSAVNVSEIIEYVQTMRSAYTFEHFDYWPVYLSYRLSTEGNRVWHVVFYHLEDFRIVLLAEVDVTSVYPEITFREGLRKVDISPPW